MVGEKISSAIKGATGEFYVAAYLSALNFVVALPRGGVPSSDLLVTTPSGGKTISLQIKTATQPENKHKKYGDYLTWAVSAKSRAINCESHWYVFVDLKKWPSNQDPPELYFVPSCDVAESLKTEWNKADATILYFPLFKEIKTEAEAYTPSGKVAADYKGAGGFRKLREQLVE